MTCGAVRRQFSPYLDGDLNSGETRVVSAHVASCLECAQRLASLQRSLVALADLPRLSAPESITSRVLDRLEVESRGPGLALVFRPAWAARPLILPSLVPAAALLTLVLSVAVILGSGAPSGTEQNPLMPSREVALPRPQDLGSVPERLAEMRQGTLFLKTVVARDGSVSALTVLDGDLEGSRALVEALRRERFDPALFRGRPVAVSVYRLISCVEVRSPTT